VKDKKKANEPDNDVMYVKPPKPISEMSDDEIDEFVDSVWLSFTSKNPKKNDG